VEIFRLLTAAADAKIQAAIGNSTPSPANTLLPEILRCPLPDPSGLTLADIIAIRRDGLFKEWRNSLADGVQRFRQYVEDNPEGWPNSDSALRDQITEAVQERAQQARKDAGWIQKPKVNVAIKGVLASGAAAAAFLAPPVVAAMAAAAVAPDSWASTPVIASTRAHTRDTSQSLPATEQPN
jgi:hypothetical protein